MPQFLIAIHRQQHYDPLVAEDALMTQEIADLNKAMRTAGVIVFVGGLQSPGSARSIQMQPDGEALIKKGLYLDNDEYVGGFWVVETLNLDDALNWGKKAAIACRAGVEVRPFHSRT
ncbi:MAG: YciI family protein [Methylophilus sp.]|uniref:YciI family protein n=1 Tax=Methylophilus sp. TaxID=29541 RepID=UPI003FA0AFFD